jgi:tRNA (guanine37-N1)-methyltransferase
MRIDIVSVLPELMQSPFETSILKRAVEKGLVEVHFHHLRDWGLGKHRQIDDEPYGGGAGMVMMIEPLDACLSELKSQREYDEVIYLTPDGETLNQRISNTLSIQKNMIFLCGHYK